MVPIDGGHHQNHPARGPLFHAGIEGIVFPCAVVGGMAILAGQAQGGGEDAHRAHELIHRNSLEHLHVFKNIFRHLRFLGSPRLAARESGEQQAHEHRHGDNNNRPPRFEIHKN
jgi:hypothetical protein